MVWELWFLEELEKKDDWLSEWMKVTEVFVEQPWLHRVCWKSPKTYI